MAAMAWRRINMNENKYQRNSGMAKIMASSSVMA
jgi:hypothetical protein